MVEVLNRRSRRMLPPFALALALTPALASSAHAASPIPLGTADSFAVLAGSTITNDGPTTVNGDIGLCCSGLSTPGFGSLTQPSGAQYAGTGTVAATAQDDLDIAYANAAGQAISATLPVDLSLAGTPALPLTPGVYESTAHGSLQINTGLTLDFGGDPNAVFIFRGTDLTTAAAAAGSVTIVNGGSSPSPCNIYWQLSSDATGVSLGTGSAFKGTTMALGASVLGTGATVEGRILTRRSKAVTLDTNTITRTACSTAAGTGGGGTTTPGGGTGSTGVTPGVTPPPGVAPRPTPRPATIALPIASPSGTAQISGPTAPVRNPFTVSVTGRAIDRVTFYLDGRKIKVVRATRGRTKFKVTINPRRQSRRVHRLTARITFKSSSRTSSTSRHLTYRTATATSHAPRFTG